MISENVKDFLTYNIDLVDSENYTELFIVARSKFSMSTFKEIVSVLESCGTDTVSPRQKLLVQSLKSQLEYDRLYTPMTINGFSRLQYQLAASDSWGFEYDEIVDFLLQNKEDLGFAMIPLPNDVSWEGSGDYDLTGDFDIEAFRGFFYADSEK